MRVDVSSVVVERLTGDGEVGGGVGGEAVRGIGGRGLVDVNVVELLEISLHVGVDGEGVVVDEAEPVGVVLVGTAGDVGEARQVGVRAVRLGGRVVPELGFSTLLLVFLLNGCLVVRGGTVLW